MKETGGTPRRKWEDIEMYGYPKKIVCEYRNWISCSSELLWT
jgi:hypothetical protein